MSNKVTFTATRTLYCHMESRKIDNILGRQISLHINGPINDVYLLMSRQIDREISDLIKNEEQNDRMS